MGLFHPDYNKPGPGVRKDEARKTGIARVWELWSRDGWDFIRANALCVLGGIPLAAGLLLGLLGHSLLVMIAAGALGGALFGPGYAALYDTILRALRDEPGYWWFTYKKAFARNWKSSLLPGAVWGLVVASQLYTAWMLLASPVENALVLVMMLCISMILSCTMFPFVFSQLVLMELPVMELLRNSIILGLSTGPKMLLASIAQAAYWGVTFMLLPLSLLWMPVVGFAILLVPVEMVVFGMLDKTFDLERRILEAQAEQRQEQAD